MEGLGTTTDLADWLLRVADRLPRGLAVSAGHRLADDDLFAVRALRGAVRSVVDCAAERTLLDAAAVAAVNVAAAAGPAWVEIELDVDGRSHYVERRSGPALTAVLSAIAQQTVSLLQQGAQLRACATPTCVLFFVKDHPRRTACSPGCRDRARAARHYSKRSGA